MEDQFTEEVRSEEDVAGWVAVRAELVVELLALPQAAVDLFLASLARQVERQLVLDLLPVTGLGGRQQQAQVDAGHILVVVDGVRIHAGAQVHRQTLCRVRQVLHFEIRVGVRVARRRRRRATEITAIVCPHGDIA